MRSVFIELVQKYTDDVQLTEDLWREIEDNYTEESRYYHNLSHIENMHKELWSVENEVEDWDTILFSMFYHDIIYNSSNNDNEIKSSELAKERLQSISFEDIRIRKCIDQILATKEHLIAFDHDTNIFTDADLSILGQPWEFYRKYVDQIRREYSQFSDLVYNSGRRNVLNHFLERNQIYKTEVFQAKYEIQARINMREELSQLL